MNDARFDRLTTLRDELVAIPSASWPGKTWIAIEAWIAKARPVVRRDWPDLFQDFQEVSPKPSDAGVLWFRQDLTMPEHEARRLWRVDEDNAERTRQNILAFLDGILMHTPEVQQKAVLDRVLFLCNRFPVFARQLKTRMGNRPPLPIEDEYDVQYLMLALLRLHFSDVRPEEWTPSYAGTGSRMDFVLKPERIIVEAKKTRRTLRDQQVGDQLIIDIERYTEHPDCDVLVCFVYDPDHWIDNPQGLEEGLSRPRGKIKTRVVVSQ